MFIPATYKQAKGFIFTVGDIVKNTFYLRFQHLHIECVFLRNASQSDDNYGGVAEANIVKLHISNFLGAAVLFSISVQNLGFCVSAW